MSRRKTRRWLARHVRDPFVRRAKAEGKRSRAAYKLAEILARAGIHIPKGAIAVDLGAAPGAWSAELAKRVGPQGLVVAVDLLPIAPMRGVEVVRGDMEEERTKEEVRRIVGARKAAIVVSDAAPNLSGVRARDQALAMRLAEAALGWCEVFLAEGGAFVVKTFRGEGWEALCAQVRARFAKVRAIKPAASRPESAEIYLVATGFRARPR